MIVILLVLCRVDAVNGQVKGIVFRDFDSNGIRSDTLPVEVGVEGIRVLAFVEQSTLPISTTTLADGTFAFNEASIPAGKRIRLEFTNFLPGDYNGPYGVASRTSVQFITAPTDQANLGIDYPADYCQRTDLQLVTPCYVNGNVQSTTDSDGNPVPADKQAAQSPALVKFPYEAAGVASATNFPPADLAHAGEVGAIWALSYQRRTKKIFSAAVVKRHTSFGPAGPGGIYITDIASGKTTPFMSVSSIGIDVGDDPHTDPLANLFGDMTQASTDPAAMTAVGRMSFGGMDISEDDKTLYFINLKDRKLYSLGIGSPAVAPTSPTALRSWNIPNPGCSFGDFRPWALKMYHGKLYVGVVCSAETSQETKDLKATIYQIDPTSENAVFTEVLAFPLDFHRGATDLTGTCIQYDHWLPWSDAWPTPCGVGNQPYFVMYPQPILTDLEFDDDGSMLIGFTDRFGQLSGMANHDPAGNGQYNGFTGGDLLRASSHNGQFELEQNGRSGSLTGTGVGNQEGPGGGEFFGKDDWFFINNIAHSEVTNGALSLVPGRREIITSAYDPIANVYLSGGLKVFNTRTGASNRDYVLYTQSPGSFGKASGLGDNKVLCDPAPLSIGNRFWFDDNRNGIQDPYEPGIDGIVLTLHDMENGGEQVASQTTHDAGQFYFTNETVSGGVLYNHSYEIRMDMNQLSSWDISLDGSRLIPSAGGRVAARGARQATSRLPRQYFLSPKDQSNYANSDTRDSDAILNGTTATIALTTLDAGQNDFTYDFSIHTCPELANEKDSIALCSGVVIDSIMTTGSYLSQVDSVRFILFSSPQSGTAMYANAGIDLGTIKPEPSTGRAVVVNPGIPTINATSDVSRLYVYALVYPIPANPACRQSSVTVISIAPSISVSATAAQLTCTEKSVQLKGEAFYGDGVSAQHVGFNWSGPNGFTSIVQNPTVSVAGTYTLTGSDTKCARDYVTATVTVMADTIPPSLTALGAMQSCVNCQGRLLAEVGEATLQWTGPNGFTSTEANPIVTIPGSYMVTATGKNGCQRSRSVEFVALNMQPCQEVRCLPIKFKRVR
ncbi:SdrD B-like domain-containing protein [Spirosoma aerolatum]|uniref:SdrD B-like domain-containing protein n=1 Tax=Spirosoma aerolatum TaxID=1211326 RepID=UPI0009AE5DE0|nr:SdrD B-like domain-containing protein [Spirosoma aerolatum]